MKHLRRKTILSLVTGFLLAGPVIGYSQKKSDDVKQIKQQKDKMKVEIWSDVMCPFCYIGKRKFEAALKDFEHNDNVEVVWKSFQLNPLMKTDPNKSTAQYLAETKGWTLEYTKNTMNYVTEMAKSVGLHYDFDRAIVANSFDAHRVLQYAKTQGKGDAMEERLFKAYFTEGKNTADHTTLTQLGVEAGLNEARLKEVLASKEFSNEVNSDIYEAQQIGVTGVPFFVINRKYAVSGAQDSKQFLGVLKKAWDELPEESKGNAGAVCSPDGECK